ncbi:MAG: binding domain of 6-phosphogluconate dehydrogenase family protein [Acidimicrobiia bacterium]|nr:binding domain of 6-phosphogluconate dehydrogenase family protein [Acidimicrobiia bacterium]
MSGEGSQPAPTVGFVGAGQMGGPMVERLLAADVALHLYARKPEVAEHFGSKGAIIAGSLAELTAACDVIIVCLFSDAQLAEVGLGADGVLASVRPGTVVASHTTAGVKTIQAMAAAATERGAFVVDAPVSGTATDILAGRLTVLLGGAEDAIERSSVPMRAYAQAMVPVGQVGDATKIKLLNNALFASQMRLAIDVMRLAGDLGVEPALAATALRKCSGDSYAMGVIDAIGLSSLGSSEPFLVKDVATVRAVAAELGVDLGLLGEVAGDGRLTG